MRPPNAGIGTSAADLAAVEGLFGLGKAGIEYGMTAFHKLIDLAKTNPLWGGVLGIITVDIASHKVDFLKWQHTETVCTDCGGILLTLYQTLVGEHVAHTYAEVTRSGILSGAATVQIAGLILSAYGIEAAGAIISDITKIDQIVGSKSDPASLLKPSITTLVEGGSGRQTTIDVSKD